MPLALCSFTKGAITATIIKQRITGIPQRDILHIPHDDAVISAIVNCMSFAGKCRKITDQLWHTMAIIFENKVFPTVVNR
ncbi:hypothetical protein SAMN02744133_103251 [Thalassospira xiamenensis M-5 = DSM 17429]|nr:hypothetical protein SAMN02744133_103251 [Thalassospira xiamenensis M-5 = DSM 17429]